MKIININIAVIKKMWQITNTSFNNILHVYIHTEWFKG